MALHTRRDFYGLATGINTRHLYPVSRKLSHITGMHVQRNKAIVGQNAFAHEAGIHQDGMLKERSTYEIMKPEDVGIPRTELVLGKHSGRHALKQRVADLGYHLTEEQLNRLFEEFKRLADRKKEIYDADIEALAENQLQAGTGNLWTLVGFTSTAGTGSQTSAAVTLKHQDGTVRRDAAIGNGPIDALFKAINRITERAGQGGGLPRAFGQPGHGRAGRGDHRDRTRRPAVAGPRGESRRRGGQCARVPGGGQSRRVAAGPRPSQAN